MKAIILAAGQAKRLRPITNNKPKCLLKVGNKIIIDHQIDVLYKYKIKNIIVVVGFQAKKLTTHLTKNHPYINFTFITNEKYASTYPAYGLWMAKNYMDDSALYLNADVLFDEKVIENIIKFKKGSVTAIQKVAWDDEEVNVIVDKNQKILKIGKDIKEKDSHGEFIGVTKFTKDFNQKLIKALDSYIKNKQHKKFAADAINLTINKYKGLMFIKDVTRFPSIEIDTPEDYKKAQAMADLLWKK